jgi:hypothetical protein
VQAKPRTKRSKAAKTTPRPTLSGTDAPVCNNSRIDDQPQYIQASELTWKEFLRGYALPNTHHRVDPLNQQRNIRWIPDDIPARASSLDVLPRMRSNIMELVGRYQQALLEPYGVYIESTLTTLVITKKFGQQYPTFDSAHQYGLTAWYRLLMYVTHERHHWSLVCVFLIGHQYIILRLDTISAEMDQNTQFIWITSSGRQPRARNMTQLGLWRRT